jgi:flagellar basal body rod protein FlgG
MRVSFESVLRGEHQAGASHGINYSRVRTNETDFSAGIYKETGNEFDLAIHGPGFFKVLGADGPIYTRNGAFTVDQQGTLRTREGYQVLDESGNGILIADAANMRISINSSGVISMLDNQGNREEIAKVAVVQVEQAKSLKRRGDNAFVIGDGVQETVIEEPEITSGTIELSNVNMVEEMGQMINGHRLYEIYHKAIKAYSTISEKQDELGSIT